jgi:hypothetical protein
MTDSYFYREFISDYNYYLENLQIPAGLENKYRAIGWDQNGHKIFSTISSVMAYIYSLIEYEINGERKDRLYEKFIEIIGEEDLELISQNFERIDKFTGK